MIFSYPRCRYPISGFASVTVSPSTFTFMFQRPCVMGCWGPMLIQNSGTHFPPRSLRRVMYWRAGCLAEVLRGGGDFQVAGGGVPRWGGGDPVSVSLGAHPPRARD